MEISGLEDEYRQVSRQAARVYAATGSGVHPRLSSVIEDG
jgi:hypothetical protein